MMVHLFLISISNVMLSLYSVLADLYISLDL